MFEYTLNNGTRLTMTDMLAVHQHYEAACTAEYIMENHGIDTEEEALSLGYDVRRLMDKYSYTEKEAINEVMAEHIFSV